jgi:protein-tyrosine phosphatase
MLGAEREVQDLTTSSAGTRAVIGHAMHAEAATALSALGGDPSGFVARHLTTRIASAADLVLTMTTAHRNSVLELAPRQLRRTFTLGEASFLAAEYEPASLADLADLRPHLAGRGVDDIPDPMGQDASYFTAIAASIARALPPIIELCRRSVTFPDC